MMNLASRLRSLRYQKGWGPDDLALHAGVSRTALYLLESGQTGRPQAATVGKLAHALGVTPEDLLGERGPGDEPVTDPDPRGKAASHGRRGRRPAGDRESPAADAGAAEPPVPPAVRRNGGPPGRPTGPDADPPGPAPPRPARASVRRGEPTDTRPGLSPEAVRKLMDQFALLLCSSMAEGIAQIVEDAFRLLPILPAINASNDRLYGPPSPAGSPGRKSPAAGSAPRTRRTRRAN